MRPPLCPFSTVPGGLATPLRCAAGAICRWLQGLYLPLCTLPSPRHRRFQESPQNLLLAGSLSCLLSLASGLLAYIHSLPLGWPIMAASLGGSHPGSGIQLLPQMIFQFNFWIAPLLHPPHPENEASTPHPDHMSGWKDLGPHFRKRNLTRNLAFPCSSLYSFFSFILVQERAESRRGTEGREGTPCHQITKGQRIPKCQPCTMHAAIY